MRAENKTHPHDGCVLVSHAPRGPGLRTLDKEVRPRVCEGALLVLCQGVSLEASDP